MKIIAKNSSFDVPTICTHVTITKTHPGLIYDSPNLQDIPPHTKTLTIENRNLQNFIWTLEGLGYTIENIEAAK